MKYLYIFTVLMLIISFVKDKKKTLQGIKLGLNKFNKILPSYLVMLIVISLILLISQKFIVQYLGQKNIILGTLTGVLIGSVTMMPGFIAYPLAGILMQEGVPFIILGGFVASLMLVGVVTYPVEKEYFGRRVTIMRNVMGVIISLGIAVGIGIFYGEVFS